MNLALPFYVQKQTTNQSSRTAEEEIFHLVSLEKAEFFASNYFRLFHVHRLNSPLLQRLDIGEENFSLAVAAHVRTDISVTYENATAPFRKYLTQIK